MSNQMTATGGDRQHTTAMATTNRYTDNGHRDSTTNHLHPTNTDPMSVKTSAASTPRSTIDDTNHDHMPLPHHTADTMNGEAYNADTVQQQLKLALHTKNMPQLKHLLDIVHEHQLPIYNILLADCHAAVELHTHQQLNDEISTVSFYIKQAVDMHSVDALQLSLNKAEHTLSKINLNQRTPYTQTYTDFLQLIETSKKQLIQLQLESSTTLQHYMKLSIVQRDAYGIQQALNKSVLHPNAVSADVIQQAQYTLSQLDAQHTAKYYVKNAVQAKDLDALQNAISEANKLGLNDMNDSDIAEASKKLRKLKQKAANGTVGGERYEKHNDQMLGSDRSKRSSWKSVFRTAESSRTATIGSHKSRSTSPPNSNTLPPGFTASAPNAQRHPPGVPLTEVVQTQQQMTGHYDDNIPVVVRDTVEYIRQHGMRVEGIFRLASNKGVVDSVLVQYTAHQQVNLSQHDIHDIVGVLKSFLRQLSEPLVTFDLYDSLINAGQRELGSTEQIDLLHNMLHELNDIHRTVLLYLLHLLHEVVQHSDVNKMSAHNIAVVFTPTLVKPAVETPATMIADTKFGIAALTTLISQYPKFASDT